MSGSRLSWLLIRAFPTTAGRLALGAAAVFAAVAVTAIAAIPGDDGAIHGCYSKSNGSLRVIDSAADRCKQNELAIAWNQTGPQGLQGEKGDPGAAGPQGETGPAGVIQTVALGGGMLEIPVTAGWSFISNSPTVTTTANQRLTGAGVATITTEGGTTASVRTDLCYQAVPGGTIATFGDSFASFLDVAAGESPPVPAAATVQPGAGTWKVGLCVQADGPATISAYTRGWVQVTN